MPDDLGLDDERIVPGAGWTWTENGIVLVSSEFQGFNGRIPPAGVYQQGK